MQPNLQPTTSQGVAIADTGDADLTFKGEGAVAGHNNLQGCLQEQTECKYRNQKFHKQNLMYLVSIIQT